MYELFRSCDSAQRAVTHFARIHGDPPGTALALNHVMNSRTKRGTAPHSWRWIVLIGLLATGCQSSPSSPSSPSGPTTPAPPVGTFTSWGWLTVPGGYQCNVQWAPTDGQPQDVTGLVTWSTADPSIATVNTVGFVTPVRSGSVAIRFSYRGAEGFMAIDVRK